MRREEEGEGWHLEWHREYLRLLLLDSVLWGPMPRPKWF